jgi:hypothetical protein
VGTLPPHSLRAEPGGEHETVDGYHSFETVAALPTSVLTETQASDLLDEIELELAAARAC